MLGAVGTGMKQATSHLTCSMRRMTTAAEDPHFVSHKLSATETSSLITRLEKRKDDAIFQQLIESYAVRMCGDRRNTVYKNVLDIGTGTGVVARRLLQGSKDGKRPRFTGRILGVDQSPFLIDAARQLTEAEGLVCAYAVADARALICRPPTELFDCIIMHTLISHVDDPLSVLRSARNVAAPGATMFIVDGDYASLSYHHPDTKLGQAVDASLVQGTFKSARVMRELPGLLQASGWGGQPIKTEGKCVSEVGSEFSYWKSFAEAYKARASRQGLVDEHDIERWWTYQKDAAEKGCFFAACTYYTVTATAGPLP